jgi:hypothetical protein
MPIKEFFSVYSSKNRAFLLDSTDIFFQIPNEQLNDVESYISDFLTNITQQKVNIHEVEKVLKLEEFGETDIYYLVNLNEFPAKCESIKLDDLHSYNFQNLDLFLNGFLSKKFLHVKNL